MLKEESLSTKLVSKGSRAYILAFIVAPGGYLIRVLISHELSISDVGIIYSILSLVSFLSMYNDLGLTESLQYYLPQYRIQKQYNRFKTLVIISFIIQIFSGLLISTLLFFSADRLGMHYFQSETATQVLKIFCLYFLGINFLQVIGSIAVAFQDTFFSQMIEGIRVYSIFAIALILLFYGQLSVISFSYAWVIGSYFTILLGGFLLYKKYGYTLDEGKYNLETPILKQQIKYAWRIFLGANVSVLFNQLDQQVVISILGSESAGYYANYLSLVSTYMIITSPILGLVFPITTELIARKQERKFQSFLDFLYKFFGGIGCFLSVFFFVYGPEIASFLYGPKFEFSGVLLQAGGIGITFGILNTINFGLLAGMGKARSRVYALGKAVIFNLVCSIGGGLLYGIRGVVGASVLSYIFLFLLTQHLIKIKLFSSYGFFIKNAISLLALGAIGYFSKQAAFEMFAVHGIYGQVGVLIGAFIFFSGFMLLINYRWLVGFKNKYIQQLSHISPHTDA